MFSEFAFNNRTLFTKENSIQHMTHTFEEKYTHNLKFQGHNLNCHMIHTH
jgi:hypothetical protein